MMNNKLGYRNLKELRKNLTFYKRPNKTANYCPWLTEILLKKQKLTKKQDKPLNIISKIPFSRLIKKFLM